MELIINYIIIKFLKKKGIKIKCQSKVNLSITNLILKLIVLKINKIILMPIKSGMNKIIKCF